MGLHNLTIFSRISCNNDRGLSKTLTNAESLLIAPIVSLQVIKSTKQAFQSIFLYLHVGEVLGKTIMGPRTDRCPTAPRKRFTHLWPTQIIFLHCMDNAPVATCKFSTPSSSDSTVLKSQSYLGNFYQLGDPPNDSDLTGGGLLKQDSAKSCAAPYQQKWYESSSSIKFVNASATTFNSMYRVKHAPELQPSTYKHLKDL